MKKSVFLSSKTVEWIECTTKIYHPASDGPKWSEAINATFEHLRFLLKNSLPDLSAEEWEIILNVYAGCYMPAHGVPARIASDMMDDLGEVSIENVRKNLPAYADLVIKIHALSQTEQFAILYFVQIFWSRDWSGDWEQIFLEIKSKFV
jgi:hypothetical protein